MRLLPVAFLFIATFSFQLVKADERPDAVIADFEQENYGRWTVAGTAFGVSPAMGALPGQMQVEGYQGKQLVNSFTGGDDAVGELTSPKFKVERKYLAFLIGGGGWKDKTCLNLLHDGKVVRTATGGNTLSGGSERLEQQRWDLADLDGAEVQLQIVDMAKGGWGHINVDQIVLTDRPPPSIISNARRDLTIDNDFLLVPVKNGARMAKVQIVVAGKTERFFDIELADGKPDWWAPLDVRTWKDKAVQVRVDRLVEDSKALEQIVTSANPSEGNQLYREKLRPQFHFSSQRGWVNDPNGLVFYKGEYHLFYQHNPYGWNWGNMHWGHAVSTDLVHWQEVGEALYPDEMGPMFSGSAVVDINNTSGFGSQNSPPLVLFYTAAGNPTVQCLAYSTDGRNFKKFDGNPIVAQLTPGNRDPKVIWHEPSKSWVMVLYVALEGEQHTIHFYRSPNLRDWKLASTVLGGKGNDKYLFECPDLFALPVGDGSTNRWVLTAADSQYAIGTFDGTTFTSEHSRLSGMQGRGFYAAQTFSDEPQHRRVQIGWGQMPSPGMPFNQLQTIPCELTLKHFGESLRMCRWPVQEIDALHGKHEAWRNVELTQKENLLAECSGELWDISLTIDKNHGEDFVLTAGGIEITVRPAAREILCQGHRLACLEGIRDLRVMVDRTSLELFAARGQVAMTLPILPRASDATLSLRSIGKSAHLQHVEVFEMNGAWK